MGFFHVGSLKYGCLNLNQRKKIKKSKSKKNKSKSTFGYMDQPIGWFSPSSSIVWQVSLATKKLTNSPALLLYIGLVHTVTRPVKKESYFASKVPEREANSNYTAQVALFRSRLSTRPTLLPACSYKNTYLAPDLPV